MRSSPREPGRCQSATVCDTPRVELRRPLDSQALGLMLMLSLIWSFQQIALKATAEDFSPMLQIAVRSGVGAALLWLFMRHRGEVLPLKDGLWRPGAAIGLLFGLEYFCVGEALQHTSAAHVVVFLYTAPVFAALGLHWMLASERLQALQWLGIGAAFAGIAVAFFPAGGTAGADSHTALWGDFLALLGGLAWGATTIVIRATRLAPLPATQTLQFQLLGAFFILLPASWLTGQTRFEPNALVWASLFYQAVVMSFFSYLVWFWMLRRYLAAQLGVLTFITPLFAVALGAWLLDEVIAPHFMGGTLLVVLGIVLVTGHSVLRAFFQRRR